MLHMISAENHAIAYIAYTHIPCYLMIMIFIT